MYKLFSVVTLLAAVNAGEYQASSYSSFNDNHNSVHHIQSGLGPVKYAAPIAPVYTGATVAKYAPAAPVYAAPVIAKYAAPVVAKLSPVAYATPVAKYVSSPSYSSHQEEYAPAKYEFAYAIQDAHTGDYHSQQEQRDGDHVVGQYSLHEADGTVRIVKYFDEGHGFNAVVERQGHPTEAPTVYKKVVAVAAPQYHH